MTSLAPSGDRIAIYDRLARRYDPLHRLWLRHAGGEAQSALEAAARVVLRPGTRLLDAGCGTGAFARRLLRDADGAIDVTLLDPSRAMLARCGDIGARQALGRLEDLPFPDRAFDLVTCAWALETSADPGHAMAEMQRVVRPGGAICLAFCADRAAGQATGWLMRRFVEHRKTGDFLDRAFVGQAFADAPDFASRWLPCRGPAAALFARRRRHAADRPE